MGNSVLPQLCQKLLSSRLRSAIFGSGARVFALGSQFLVLILMNRLMPKDAFGELMIVFTIYRLINLGLGSSFGSIVLYHVSRHSGDHVLDVQLMRCMYLFGGAVSLAVLGGAVAFAPQIAGLFAKPGMVEWLVNLSPMIVFGTLLQITASSFDGRSQVPRSIMVTEVMPNAIRMTGFVLAWLLGAPAYWVAVILWVGPALPWCVDVVRVLSPTIKGIGKLTWWDLRYGGWLGSYSMLGQQLQGIDMLLVGTFFSSTIAADYSIASRLASFYPFLLQIVMRTVMPKVGPLFHAGDISGVNTLLSELSRIALPMVAGLAGVIIGVAPFVVHMSGDYIPALPIMVALVVAPLIGTMFVGVEAVLRMSGQGAIIAMVSGSSSLILCLGSFALHKVLGIYALPASMALSTALVNYSVTLRVRRMRITLFNSQRLVMLVPLCITLVTFVICLPSLVCAILSAVLLLAAAGFLVLPRYQARYLGLFQ